MKNSKVFNNFNAIQLAAILILGIFVWCRKHPADVKKPKAVHPTDFNKTLDSAIAIDTAVAYFPHHSAIVVPQKVVVALPIKSSAPIAVKIVYGNTVPDCDSAKTISPCKVEGTVGYIEFNNHKK